MAALDAMTIRLHLPESLQADYVAASCSFGNTGLSPEIEADLSALPEVAAVSPVRTSPVEVDGSATQLAAVDTRTIGQVADLGVTAGRLADVSGLSVARGRQGRVRRAGGGRHAHHDLRPHRSRRAHREGSHRPAAARLRRDGLRGRPRHLRGQRHRPVRPSGLREGGQRGQPRPGQGRPRQCPGRVAQRHPAGPGCVPGEHRRPDRHHPQQPDLRVAGLGHRDRVHERRRTWACSGPSG